MKRFGSATWSGGLREGKGSVSTESRALETYRLFKSLFASSMRRKVRRFRGVCP
jgi:hypothetical protein